MSVDNSRSSLFWGQQQYVFYNFPLISQQQIEKSSILVIGLSPLTISCIRTLIAMGCSIYCMKSQIGYFSVADPSLISDSDIQHCFEFTIEKIGKRKDEVIQDYFKQLFPSVTIKTEISNTSKYSCVLSESCSASIDLFSFSFSVYLVEYYERNIILSFYSQCIVFSI